MNIWSWLIIIILALLLIFLILAIKQSKKTGQLFDYFGFFISGLIWLPIGAIYRNWSLVVMGAVFLLVGLANKRKWRQRLTWRDLTPGSKKWKMTMLSVLGLLALLGLVLWLAREINK